MNAHAGLPEPEELTMSTQLEREFVEGASRTVYVMAWAEREENPPEGLREIEWHNKADESEYGAALGRWGEQQPQPQGHRAFTPWPSGEVLYLFGDEVDSDEPAPARSFAGQRLEDVAPPTPAYAREWAWKLLGALEEINPQWGRNLPSILAAAARVDCPGNGTSRGKHVSCRLCDNGLGDVRAFGSDIAMMALGTGVSWFDDHAEFELHVPEWDARGFELEEDEPS